MNNIDKFIISGIIIISCAMFLNVFGTLTLPQLLTVLILWFIGACYMFLKFKEKK